MRFLVVMLAGLPGLILMLWAWDVMGDPFIGWKRFAVGVVGLFIFVTVERWDARP